MKITEIIRKEDLGEPYGRLSFILNLDEIIKLEQEYGGRQVRFEITCEDAKTEYPELVALLGAVKAFQVIKGLGGERTYFPELKRSCVDKIKSLIISEYNGYNYLQLARKYGYTERHIRRIVAEKGRQRKKVDENQLSLFD